MNGLLLPLAGLALVGSALLSVAESATFAVGPSRLRTLREEGFRGSETLQAVRDRGSAVRAAVFLVNTLLNGVAVGMAAAFGALRWGPLGAFAGLGAGLAAVLLLAEMAPRLVASRRAIRLALLSAPSLRALEAIVRPFSAPLEGVGLPFASGNGEAAASAGEREVRELTELGRREGVVEVEEHELVERAFRMDELAAWDVMTPRVDIFAWKDSLPLEEVIPHLRDVPYSRVPVYGRSIDDITGILYVREAYEAYVAGRRDLLLSELSREPFFVPGSLPLPRLLRDFQARKIHMGIVADEFGGTDGLVTLEDVIEELVGEIEDETDVSEESFVRISRTEMDVEGGIELREVNYVFNVSLPHLEHRSLNGFLLEELGRVPEVGDRLELPGLEIEILEATETQVVRARLRKTHPAPAEEMEGSGGQA